VQRAVSFPKDKTGKDIRQPVGCPGRSAKDNSSGKGFDDAGHDRFLRQAGSRDEISLLPKPGENDKFRCGTREGQRKSLTNY